MGVSRSPVQRVFTDQDMAHEPFLTLACGRVAVYSARCPDRDGANEDAASVLAIDSERGVLAVADGVGGQAGGENAAEIALRCLKQAVTRTQRSETSLRGAILDACESANHAVMDLGIGAATTLAIAEIAGPTLRPYHVGDSAILVVGQRGKVKLQTISHSPVGYAVESGLIAEHEAMHHDERHLISNAVGAPDMRIEIGSPLRLAPRDTVLLATDGLFDNLAIGEIVDAIRTKPLSVVAEHLAGRVGERMREPAEGEPSKPDDVTFILFRLATPSRGASRPQDGAQ
ncbi:MAG: serine/threonine-protein phosphatase [Deltaproteobacteria bacterium]|nr:MAG: serine/threonine-protein phosphatase [Deltaproteobacteria bacterium]